VAATLAAALSLVACSGTSGDVPDRSGRDVPDDTSQNGTGQNGTGQNGTGQNGTGQNGTGQNGTGQNGTGQNGTGGPTDDTDRNDADLVVRPGAVLAEINPLTLGTNVPAWLLPDLLTDARFVELTRQLGTTLLRLPGGSWSNGYHWLACEREDESGCFATWGAAPSDLLGFMHATGLPGMWTAAFSGTAHEAAAAVAFFNGAIDDQRPIGVDRNGHDWGVVAEWAALRAERGFAEPVPITYWEIGNEIYGALGSAGPACAPWGWEHVWTCDPAEYVLGDDEHDGLLAFAEAMTAVDPTIQIGAVGVGDRGEWNDWDDTVIGTAGDVIDFYVVHHYGSDGDRSAEELLDVPRAAWPRITADMRQVFVDHGLAADLPIAVTEHNMVSFIDADDARLMPSAANAFYLAETIGQLILSGVPIANQWNLMNGRADNGSDYGLVDGTTMQRAPAYYALALWARAGTALVEVDVNADLGDLRVYGLRSADGLARLLVLNPTGSGVPATIGVEGDPAAAGGPGPVVVDAHVVAASSLDATTMTFNGAAQPAPDLSDPPARVAPEPPADGAPGGRWSYHFAPFSLTLLEWHGE